jgi:hypothetical protein
MIATGKVKRRTFLFPKVLFEEGLTGDLRQRMADVLREEARTGILNEREFQKIIALASANLGHAVGVEERGADAAELDGYVLDLPENIEITPFFPSPPALAEYIAILTANSEQGEALVGDLDEQFQEDCKRFGPARAARRYRGRVLRSIWPLLRSSIGRMVKWGAILAAVKRLFL